jgi:endonuclease YncB( thermonuclease family)
MYDYHAQMISITDGDSAHIEIDLGLKIFHRTNCRLFGINTPELNSTDPIIRTKAQAAKARLAELIEGKKTLVYSHALDKYGRPLVTIFLDGENINQRMIAEGFAVEMKGVIHGPAMVTITPLAD